MRKNRIIFDFGSTYFTIYSEGRLLLRKPTAIVLKKSLQPQIVATGAEALKRKDAVNSDELYLRPVKKGAVAHREGCILLIKSYLAEAVGRFKLPKLCVLVGCGLQSEQRIEIEKVFVDAGYSDIILMESLLGLVLPAKERGLKAGLIIGGETTDFGVFDDGKLILGYTLELGSGTVNERIKTYVRDRYKLNVSDGGAEDLKLKAASLYPDDMSMASIAGKDAITGKQKKLMIKSDEIYKETTFVYSRIINMIAAALEATPIGIAQDVVTDGILVAGYGSFMEGFVTYATNKLEETPIILAELTDRMPFSGAETLINDSAFEREYLGVSYDERKPFFKRN